MYQYSDDIEHMIDINDAYNVSNDISQSPFKIVHYILTGQHERFNVLCCILQSEFDKAYIVMIRNVHVCSNNFLNEMIF